MEGKIRGAGFFDTESATRNIREKALRGGAAMLLSRSVNAGVQFGSAIILARLLGPKDFGLFAMVTAFSLLLANVGYNGFIEAIVQTEDISHQQVSALFWLGLGISVGLAILFSASSYLLVAFYKEPKLAHIAIALSTGFVFNALTTTHLALIMRRIRFRDVMLNEIASVVVSNVVAVAMALKGFGYWALIFRQLVGAFSTALIAWIQCSWRPGLPRRLSQTKRLIEYAARTYINYAVTYLGRNLDKVLIGWRWGPRELGNYDRAYQLFVMPAGQMVTPLASVALATLSRLRDDAERYRRYFLRSLSIIAFFGMFASGILTVAGRDIIIFLLGDQWAKAGHIFTAFGPSVGITLVYGTHSWLHLSLGRPERWLKWSLVALGVTALLFLIGLEFGGIGIAVAYSLSYYLLVGPALLFAGKPIGITAQDIWGQLWKYLAASVLSASTVWLTFARLGLLGAPASGSLLLMRILAVGLTYSLVYCLAVLVFFRSLQPFRDLFVIVREMTARRKPGTDNT